MKIQKKKKNINFKNIEFNSVNGGHENSKYSNKCNASILVLYNSFTKPFIIISADIIWFSEKIVHNLKQKAIQIYNTNSSNVVFCASHTHGSPNPSEDILYGKGTKIVFLVQE